MNYELFCNFATEMIRNYRFMKRIRLYLSTMLLLAAGSINAQDRLYADEFPLGDVTLLDGPLKKARDLNVKVLLQYDNDRLLAPFLK